jgi:hypothetical protein
MAIKMATRRPMRRGARRRGDPLPTLGDLRKGAPKSGGVYMGRELQDFRICNYDMQTDTPEARTLRAFVEAISREVKPKEGEAYRVCNHLEFVFAYPGVRENLVVFNECYKGGLMVHRCTADEDAVIVRALDPISLKPIIVDGHDVETGEVVHCDGKPIYSYTSKNGDEVQVGCSPVVRLKVMLVGQGQIGTWDVLSTSGIDGDHLLTQLEHFYDTFANSGFPGFKENGLKAIPFVLHRLPPVEVAYYDASDQRKTSKHSFIDVTLSPRFGALYMEAATRMVIGTVEPPKQITAGKAVALLEAGDSDDENDELLDVASGGAREPSEEGVFGPSDNAEVVDGTPEAAARPNTDDTAEKVKATWQAAFEGLGLSKSRMKAVLERYNGNYEKAYKFAHGELEEKAARK